MREPAYIVGIDLGTSNCAMAAVELARGATAPISDCPIPQLRRLGEVGVQPLLPSCLYLPAEHELPPEGTRLPWGDGTGLVVGEFARWQGARVPGRLVVSAKSWLCHPRLDRSAPILPWGAPAEVRRISPVEATAQLLGHLILAWNSAHPETPLAAQEAVITVPASFDEVARALTVNATRQAGLEKFVLVEEPQAAFYDFMARHRGDLAQALGKMRLVLVVDVGGGTTDFTLVQVEAAPDEPKLRRIAVGEHLMLGGDNMDAALARHVEGGLGEGSRKLSPSQWTQLLQAIREAKESLLSQGGPDRYHLSVVAEGSRLMGRSLSAQLTRREVERIILDGFFPACAAAQAPERALRLAIQEMGLPYAQDPAITRHLAAFLCQHAQAALAAQSGAGCPPVLRASDAANSTRFEKAGGGQDADFADRQDARSTDRQDAHSTDRQDARPTDRQDACPTGGHYTGATLPRPDAILLNGGVFNSPKIAQRLVEVVSAWWPSAPLIPLLHHDSLELAVARGAAYYGLVRHGLGRRIGGGAAHAFYVGLGSNAEKETPLALCVIPRGHEEGERVKLGDRIFHLTLGRPVQFPLYSTAADRIDKAGEVVPVSEALHPLPPLQTLLKSAGGKSENVLVHLQATLTEIGTLELECVANAPDERWRLEFNLRGAAGRNSLTVTESMPAQFGPARQWIQHIFGGRIAAEPAAHPVTTATPRPHLRPPKEVKQLWSSLEQALGPRENWRGPVLRELWSLLRAGAARRRRSPAHERIFFQLTGYCLRPGFGYPLDEWRSEQTFDLFAEGVQFHKDKAVWIEFWVMWRRIAGGLDEARQAALWAYLKPYLAHRLSLTGAGHPPKPKGIQPEGLDEMIRTAAALEHLPPAEKAELGQWIVARLRAPTTATGGPWTWSLSRLGARAPLYGSGHKTVSPAQAEQWLRLLLELDLKKVDGALFAIAQLARLTGDRMRDLDDGIRACAVAALQDAHAPESWLRMVTQVAELEVADEARALGDTLPSGLQIS